MKRNVIISIYDMEIGGIERSLINMLQNFNYDIYNVDLLLFTHKGDLMNLIPSQVHVLPQEKRYTLFRKPIIQCIREGQFAAALIRILSRYIASRKGKSRSFKEGSGYIQMQLILKYLTFFIPKLKQEYDYAISYAWPHDIIAKKVKAKKKIAWIHTDYSELEIDNDLDFKVWNRFDYIASISDACTHSFLTKYPQLKGKIISIENINSPDLITALANESIPPHEIQEQACTFTIVSVGRLSYVKGFDMAVRALRTLHDDGFTNIKWYVVGYGGYEAALRDLIEVNNLQESFVLLGKKTNPYPYIKACNLYVQPSRYEGKAVTVTEAKILHKPVLITNYPTACSQVEDGVDGVICELSVEGIAKGIKEFYQSAELRNKFILYSQDRDYSNSYELKKLYNILA